MTRQVRTLSPPPPPNAPLLRPSPWRMAELEERVHTLENRQREQALRNQAQDGPEGPAAGAPAA